MNQTASFPRRTRRWLSWRKPDVALALSGDRLWLAESGDGEPVTMPAYVAVATADGRVVAVGDEARAMAGLEPGTVAVLRLTDPAALRDDPELLVAAVRHLLHANFGRGLVRPRVVFVAEANIRREVRAAALRAGAREVVLLEPPMAAAIGAGLAVEEPLPRGVLVLDRHTCSFAVIALAGVMAGFAEAQGVGRLLDDIVLHTRTEGGHALGVDRLDVVLRRNGLEGLATDFRDTRASGIAATLSAEPIARRAAQSFQEWLAWQYRRSLESLPPGKRRGAETAPIFLVGPYAGVAGMQDLAATALVQPVSVPENPAACMILGARSVLADLDFLLRFASKARQRT